MLSELAVAQGVGFSTNNTVASSCPAGVLHLTILAGETARVSLPFKPYDFSVNGMLDSSGVQKAFRWDSSEQRYIPVDRVNSGGRDEDLFPQSTQTFAVGEGFVVVNKQSYDQEIYFCGDVVLEPSIDVKLQPFLNLVGSPYASRMEAWLQTQAGASNLTMLSEANVGMNPGTGYWINNASSKPIIWKIQRPYGSDFLTNSTAPTIRSVQLLGGGTASSKFAKLNIGCSGEAGEKLDVLYQDMKSLTNQFDPLKNWKIAELGITSSGRTEVDWIDKGENGRVLVNEVAARFYLVGLSGSSGDQDHDGVSDTVEKYVFASEWQAYGRGSNEQDRSSLVASNAPGLPRNGDGNRGRRGNRVIYVDQLQGADANTGELEESRKSNGMNKKGPKKTIRAGLMAATAGDTLVVKAGNYNESMNLAGSGISVRFVGRVKLQGAK